MLWLSCAADRSNNLFFKSDLFRPDVQHTCFLFFFLFSASLALFSCESTLLCLTRVPGAFAALFFCGLTHVWACLTCQLVHVGVVLKSTISTAGRDHEMMVRPTSTSEQVVYFKLRLAPFFQKRDVFRNVKRKFCIVHFQRTNVERRGGI